MTRFDKSTLLLTGGTGSFCRAVTERLLNIEIKELRVFSRDEKKQDDMRQRYKDPRIKFFIGDVRDPSSLDAAMSEVDFVFHAAALKQVPSCEFFPMEAFKTNVVGTQNVLEVACRHGVQKVVCLSTDKSVYPINAMGMSKAMMEKIVVAKSRTTSKTVVCITRYGNVMGSRGSVIPLFLEQISANIPLTITDPQMTRFMMSLDEAVDLVLFAFNNGRPGDIFIQKSPATSVQVLSDTLKSLVGDAQYPVQIIGTRHGEKLYESLMSREERATAVDMGDYFRIPPDGRGLNYSCYEDRGIIREGNDLEYTSHNTRQLDIAELREILVRLDFVKTSLMGV